jgi:hypothetical protein
MVSSLYYVLPSAGGGRLFWALSSPATADGCLRTGHKRRGSLPAGVAGATLHPMRLLFTARTRRLASTPQAAAALPARCTAKGSRALYKLRSAGPGAGGRANPGSYWAAAPGRLLVPDVLSRPYIEPPDHPAARVQGAPVGASII